MSVLTRIQNLKSRYSRNIGLIQSEQDVYKDFLGKRKTAFGNLEKKQAHHAGFVKAYEGFQQEYKDLQTEYGGKVTAFKSTYGADALTDRGESFYKSQYSKFQKTSGYKDWSRWMGAISAGAGWAVRDLYDRSDQGRADYKSLIEDPMAQYESGHLGLSAYTPKFEEASAKVTGGYEAVEASYKDVESLAGQVSSYDKNIVTSLNRIKSYGATQKQIMGNLETAEDWLGYDREARKRGTRRSAQRRTMLTSRSAYA